MIGEAETLHLFELGARDRGEPGEPLLRLEQLPELVQKPGIDPGRLRDVLDTQPRDERVLDLEDPFRRRRAELDAKIFRRRARQPVIRERSAGDPPRPSDLESAQPFLEGFLEGPSDGHRLADGFHLGGETIVGAGKLLECEPRDFHDDVVEHRLERSWCGARDVVGQFVERVSHGELCADARDGESGRFGREG